MCREGDSDEGWGIFKIKISIPLDRMLPFVYERPTRSIFAAGFETGFPMPMHFVAAADATVQYRQRWKQIFAGYSMEVISNLCLL